MTDRASEPEPADELLDAGRGRTTDFDTHSPPDRSAYDAPARPDVRGDHDARAAGRPSRRAEPDRGPGDARRRPVAADAARGHDARAGRSAAALARERGAALHLHPAAAARAGAERRRARDHQVAARRDRRRRCRRGRAADDHSSAPLIPSLSMAPKLGGHGAHLPLRCRDRRRRRARRGEDDAAPPRGRSRRPRGSSTPTTAPRRGPLLYPGHYARIAAAIAGGRPAVIHSRGTLPIARRTIALLARLRGRPAHLVLLHADRADGRGRPARPRPDGRARRDGPSGRPLAGAARRRRADRRGLGVGHAARPQLRPPR